MCVDSAELRPRRRLSSLFGGRSQSADGEERCGARSHRCAYAGGVVGRQSERRGETDAASEGEEEALIVELCAADGKGRESARCGGDDAKSAGNVPGTARTECTAARNAYNAAGEPRDKSAALCEGKGLCYLDCLRTNTT